MVERILRRAGRMRIPHLDKQHMLVPVLKRITAPKDWQLVSLKCTVPFGIGKGNRKSKTCLAFTNDVAFI